jgi:hypothetical protein
MNKTYIQVFISTVKLFHTRYENFTLKSLFQDFKECEGNLTSSDILGTLFFIIFFAKSRIWSQNYLFLVCLRNFIELNNEKLSFQPLCEYLKSDAKSRIKVCESAFKTLFHTTCTLIAAQILFRQNCEICFHDFDSLWNGMNFRAKNFSKSI